MPIKFINRENNIRKEHFIIFARSFKKPSKEATLFTLKNFEKL